MIPVTNRVVWKQIQIHFMASVLLFLVNILFGFDNIFTPNDIPRWQVLMHTHAGTLGWVTLSIIGLVIWVFTGERQVSEAYAKRVRTMSWLAIAAFAGYIAAFGLAFRFGPPFFYLLPVFGIPSSLIIWTTAIFAFTQLRYQPTVTTAHVLLTSGILVAALGSTVGVLLGLEYLVGFFVPGDDRIGLHAGAMDAYLLLSSATIVELFLRKDSSQRWTRAGLALAIIWGIAGLPLAEALAPLLLVGLIIYVARMGWRAFTVNPFGAGARRWVFFGNIWMIFWGGLFVWAIYYILVVQEGDFNAIPPWLAAVFVHSAFIGMMTNMLLGLYSARSQEASHIWPAVETASMWLINLGLLTFFTLKIIFDIRYGALVMGTGVLLGVLTMIVRLRTVGTEEYEIT